MFGLTYVDDRMAFGKPEDVKKVLQDFHKRFLSVDTGMLNDDGDQVRF